MKSTSLHIINADNKYRSLIDKVLVRLLFYPLNRLNNLLPNWNVDGNIKIKNFRPANIESDYAKCPVKSSPSRKLSDLFWMNLEWDRYTSHLGSIKMLDIGCGNGNYYTRFNTYSDGKINRYIGIDVYENKNWSTLKTENPQVVDFIKYDGMNISAVLSKNNDINFIVSQSALQHIKYDLSVFKQIREFIKEKKYLCRCIYSNLLVVWIYIQAWALDNIRLEQFQR